MSMNEEMHALEMPVVEPTEVHYDFNSIQPERRLDLEFLKSKTGEGELEDYKDHPLNFQKSKPMARIIRGFTGIFGNINFAVADILIGLFEMRTPKGVAQHGTDIQQHGGVS